MKMRYLATTAISVLCLAFSLFLVFPTTTSAYDPFADINDDGIVNILDAIKLGVVFGTTGDPSGKWLSEASFIIFTDGSNYYCKNGTSGAVTAPDTNASRVVNFCIQNISTSGVESGENGSLICFKKGLYTFDTPILMDHSAVVLEGEGRGTVFRPDSNLTQGGLRCIVNVTRRANPPSTGLDNSTEAITIKDICFYAHNIPSFTGAAILFHNAVINGSWGRILHPTVQNCYFDFTDGITTDTESNNSLYEAFELQHLNILDCTFSWTPHFAIKLWEVMDGNIRNVFVDRDASQWNDTNTVGIEINYPIFPRGSGLYFDDIRVFYAQYGINCTNADDVFFTNIITDMILRNESVAFNLNNCHNIMVTNAYSSAYNGRGFNLNNSYNCKFVSCKAYNCTYGFYSADETVNASFADHNFFEGCTSIGNMQGDWYHIQKYDKFSGCNYIIQNASKITILSGTNNVPVSHGLSLANPGAPETIIVTPDQTFSAQNFYLVSVSNANYQSFTIYRNGTAGDLTVYWYAAMSSHIP